ncbi:hypothetical protein YSA_03251 [Pseudomonas putida ND6]|uniref:Uncharacterized protein n=1 Tax=Pseudomonas putida ND6 TaxID=231023 RepID=I3USR5_PSEPU|nr:hypothetical protein YSA_03251 [Pseudomonas putida ND6]
MQGLSAMIGEAETLFQQNVSKRSHAVPVAPGIRECVH